VKNQTNAVILAVTALICLVIAAIGYFVAIAPQLSAAATARSNTAAAVDQNTLLEQQVAALQARDASIDTVKAQVDDLARLLPPTESLLGTREDVSTLVTASGVTLTAYNVATPEPILSAPRNYAAAAAAVGKESAYEALQFHDLYATPITLTIIGSDQRTKYFLSELQFGEHRYTLVDKVDVSTLQPAAAQGAIPEVLAGDVQMTIYAFVFTLPPVPPAPIVGTDPSTVVQPAPAPSQGAVASN
jgi:hypothetical protein